MVDRPESERAAPAASLQQVSCLFPTGRGVEELTFEAAPGEVLGLLGNVGAGCTTALRLLAGELEPTRGALTLLGATTGPARREVRRRIGFQPSRDAHFGALSGFRNACFFASLHGLGRQALLTRVDGLFDELDLRSLRDVPVASWDADASRRLSILEALLPEPALLALDEPFEPLGFGSRAGVRHAMSGAASRGAAVVFCASHSDEAARLCRRVALLHRGRLVALGAPAELIREHGAAVRRERPEPTLADVYLALTGEPLGED